jgi:hypothetical protein
VHERIRHYSLVAYTYSLMFRSFTRLVADSTRVPIRRFTTSPTLRRPIEMDQVNTTARLQRLRELMTQHKVDIYSMSQCHSHT